jgi:phage-related minor tail protein
MDTDQRIIEIVLKAQDANASLKEMATGAAVMTAQLSRMGQDDPGRAQLLADLQQMNQRLSDGRAAMRQRVQSAEELAAADVAAAAAAEQLAQANEETVTAGKKATASLNEMKAAAVLMEKQLLAMSQDDPNRAALQRDFTQLNQRIGEATTSMRTHIKTEAELAAEQAALAASTEELNRKNLQVVVDGQKVNATFGEMKASAAQLEKQLENMSRDDPGRAKLLADYKALGQRIEEVKNEMGQATEKGSLMKDALAFAGVTVGAEAVLEGIKELGAEIINTTKEVANLRGNINTLTGATGAELDGLTTSVLAVSRTFGKDFNEVLQASNTLSKQMGVSQQEAMRLIQQGFLAGADAGGDFLDQVKEYAPQFKDAGFAAQDFIGHISQASTQGIFSDKGADVVKEFGLRIREQTKATTEAMQAAFGSDFTKQIFDGIKDGSLTVEQALQKVGKELDETKIPANQLQTVIADVFGGPGEDAGIDYLKSLKNVGKGVDELVDKTNAYTQRQAALLDSNDELAQAQNDLTKQFEGGSTVLETLTNKGMTVLYTLLASLGTTFKELFQPVQDIWKSLTDLAESMGWLSQGTLSAASAGEGLGNVIRWMMAPTKMLWGLIADVVKATVEWAKTSDVAKAFLQELTRPVRDLFFLLSNAPGYFAAFSAAAEAAFGGVGRAWTKVKGGDFSGAGKEFTTLGTAIGEAYNKAFAAAATKKVEATPTVSVAAGAAPEKRAQGGDGITDADRQKAAEKAQKDREKAYKEAKAARDKADQAHLDDLKTWVKEEGSLLDGRNVLKAQREQQAQSDEEMRRELERQKVFDAADKKAAALTGKEADYTERVAAIMAERDLHLRELQAKYNEQDEQERQKKLEEKLATSEEDEALEIERLENKRANGLLSEAEYQAQLYELQRQGLEKRLQLLKDAGQGETNEAKKTQAALLKGETAHVSGIKKAEQELMKSKAANTAAGMTLLSDSLSFLVDNLGQQTAAYVLFKSALKTLQLAEVGLNLQAELSNNALAASDPRNPLHLLPGGEAIIASQLAIKNGLAIGRAALSAVKIAAFAQGGNTTKPQELVSVASAAGLISGASGGSFAAGGPVDKATIGLIGEAGPELVIPNWLYADPRQANLMGFLEAQIASRGNAFATGGSTTGASAVASPASDDSSGQLVELMQLFVKGQQEFREEIADWQRNLVVQNNLQEVAKGLKTVQDVKQGGGIR